MTQRVIQSIWMVLAALFIASSLFEGYLVLPGTHGHSIASLLARGFLVLAPLAALFWGRQYSLTPRGPLFLLAGWLLVVALTFWFASPHIYYVEYYVWSQITGGLLVLTSWTLAGFPKVFRQTQVGALILYGLAVVGVGLWEVHTGHHLGPSRVGSLSHIPTGFYYDQNSLGVAIALILPYILLLGGLWPTWPVYSLSALLAVLLTYILYKTGSRGGEIALLLDLAILALVAPLSFRRLLKWLFGGLIVALALVIGVLHTLPPTAHLPFALEKIAHLTHLVTHPNAGPSSVTIRLALYRSGWHAFITHPWGLGPRGAERYYAYWVHHKSPWNTYGVIDAHNMWLEVAMDFGVVGFLLYAGFYGWLLWGLMRLRPAGNRELEYFRAASLSSLVGFIVGSLSPSSVMIGFHIMWVIYGIALGTLVMAQRIPNPRLDSRRLSKEEPPMREGLVPGTKATVTTTVTEQMVARLGGQKVHPVLATAQMIEWMEWAGRKLILPYLEDDEDAVGYAVDIVHLAPTLVGETFSATAELLAIDKNRIIARVTAENGRGLIGRGQFTQVLLPKKALEDKIRDLSHHVSSDKEPTANE